MILGISGLGAYRALIRANWVAMEREIESIAGTLHDSVELIKVTDTGIGIPPTEQAHIFDRFYRVNRDRSRHTGGSGLGLAIARAIATAHHGSLQVDSQLGVGSTFTIRLPLRG